MNETKVVLEGRTIGGKTMREHLEVINHRDAIAYVEVVQYVKWIFLSKLYTCETEMKNNSMKKVN